MYEWDDNPNGIALEDFNQAVNLADKCIPEDERNTPYVGVVIKKNGEIITESYRNQTGHGDHAEFIALELSGIDAREFIDADLLTTLEPCTIGRHGKGKKPCAEWIWLRRIRKVWIGVLDRNPRIHGNAIIYLRNRGISIGLFPDRFVERIIKQNTGFFKEIESKLPTLSAANREIRLTEIKDQIQSEVDLLSSNKSIISQSQRRFEICDLLRNVKNRAIAMESQREQEWLLLGIGMIQTLEQWAKYTSDLGSPPTGIAERIFKTALSIDPKYVPAWVGLSKANLLAKDTIDSWISLENAYDVLKKEQSENGQSQLYGQNLADGYLDFAWEVLQQRGLIHLDALERGIKLGGTKYFHYDENRRKQFIQISKFLIENFPWNGPSSDSRKIRAISQILDELRETKLSSKCIDEADRLNDE